MRSYRFPCQADLALLALLLWDLPRSMRAGVCTWADNQRISVTQRQSVEDARLPFVMQVRAELRLKKILEEEKFNSSIYITLGNPEISEKRAGRITPAAAAIGTVLNLKPVRAASRVRSWMLLPR